MNVAQEYCLLRNGAGSMPCSFRMRLIVFRPTSYPTFLSAPRSLV